ncbi:hypothetical protein CU254_24225 [Amycolatopsis sp. AA4]|uniref:hypothetical protein n=1 Tax=Actinomycetes TaxID=1760 RepID=UPI0001B56610|nr:MULTISPECIES: hypothetical protein [Actinomycetes]ATY13200.1 hypothetical protein CU254_24225 [Amycolatopsis sp. AA4]EFL09099.1 predicted protein [Streptomyces sp. AA4]
MTGYQVVIDKIRHSGQAAGRVAAGLRGAACSAAAPGGDAGVPGARAVGKLASVKQAWQDRERGYGGKLDEHAANMSSAADRYSRQESAAVADLGAPKPTGMARPI